MVFAGFFTGVWGDDISRHQDMAIYLGARPVLDTDANTDANTNDNINTNKKMIYLVSSFKIFNKF